MQHSATAYMDPAGFWNPQRLGKYIKNELLIFGFILIYQAKISQIFVDFEVTINGNYMLSQMRNTLKQ